MGVSTENQQRQETVKTKEREAECLEDTMWRHTGLYRGIPAVIILPANSARIQRNERLHGQIIVTS